MPRYSSTVQGGGKRGLCSSSARYVVATQCFIPANGHRGGIPIIFIMAPSGITRTRHFYYSKSLGLRRPFERVDPAVHLASRVSSSGSLAMFMAMRRAWSLVNLNAKLVLGQRPLIDHSCPL